VSHRLDDLAQRKTEVLERSDRLRQEIGFYSEAVQARLATVDNGILAVKRIATNPLVVAGGALAVFMVGPRKLLRLASRGFFFFSTARRIWQNLR
jgi:hypothetical protein